MLSHRTVAPPEAEKAEAAEQSRPPRDTLPLPGWLVRLSDAGEGAILLGLVAALLLPQVQLSSRLPAVRPEQLLLPYALFVFCIQRRAGRRYSPGFLDWIFGGLAISTLLSVVGGPLILHSRVSTRDFYEPVKLLLYYCFYRLAYGVYHPSFDRACDEERAKPRLLQTLLVAGGLNAAFGVAQYFDWLRVNAWLTPIFAPEPHLSVLRQSGRVVGTVGNPNYFGIVCVILLLAVLASLWLAQPRVESVSTSLRGGPARVAAGLLAGTVAALAAFGLVMSGSRTALLALAGAIIALFILAALRQIATKQGALLRLTTATAVILVLLAGAMVVVGLFPRGNVTYLGRLGGGLGISDDASFGLRLARWRSVLDAWLPGAATTGLSGHTALTTVHATGTAPAAPSVLARDEQRKADLLELATAIDAYHHATGNWPPPTDLGAALVPRFISSLPRDPATRELYVDVPVVTGYSLMARLENPADADYPIYGIGSSPNYLLNGNLERGRPRPSNWDAIPGTSFAGLQGDALFGERAVVFRGAPGHPEQRGGIFQQRYFGRPGGNPFTATAWVKLQRAETGQLELYANVIYTDGSRADPLTRIPADMSRIGVWQKVSLGILPPADKTVAFLGVYVVSEGFSGEALLDGFELVDGPVPLSFAITREAPPSDTLGFNPEAKLRRSPIIGVGPEKGEQGSSLDDEYLLYAARYGIVGILLYLALYIGTLALAVRAAARARGVASRRLAVLVAATIVAFLIFNVTAGSFYELQLMAIFWLLAGAALGSTALRANAGADASMDSP